MTLQELKIAVLDEISTLLESPVVDAEDTRETIERLFREYADGQKKR